MLDNFLSIQLKTSKVRSAEVCSASQCLKYIYGTSKMWQKIKGGSYLILFVEGEMSELVNAPVRRHATALRLQ